MNHEEVVQILEQWQLPEPLKKWIKQRPEIYLVGGSVRDKLLHREKHNEEFEWDVCGPWHPNDLALLPQESRKDVGIKFGHVLVQYQGITFDYTQFRIDIGIKNHRHPIAIKQGSLQEDLCRRDFTINTFYWSPSEKNAFYHDLAITDLHNRVIRAVGNPLERFREDALRILRGLRFTRNLNCAWDPATYEAAVELSPLLENLSLSRIAQEIQKIPPTDDFAQDLAAFAPFLFGPGFEPKILCKPSFQSSRMSHQTMKWIRVFEQLVNDPKSIDPKRMEYFLGKRGTKSLIAHKNNTF